MTIKYSDWVSGNDTTGDGSRTNPYKTIDKASTGLTGGDEVRVKQSPANSDITAGNLSWTDGSSTVYTSGGWNPTGIISVNEVIRKKTLVDGDYPFWYRVLVVYSNRVDIRGPYIGVSDSNALSQKHGLINVGIMGGASTPAQKVMASGTSLASRLKISGGWDLSVDPPTQPDITWYIEGTANPLTANGYGLSTNQKSFLEIEKFGMVKFSIGYRNDGPSTGITYNYCDGSSLSNLHIYYFFSSATVNQPICSCGVKNAVISNQQGMYLSGYGGEYYDILSHGGSSQLGQYPGNRNILHDFDVCTSAYTGSPVTSIIFLDSILYSLDVDDITYGILNSGNLRVYDSKIDGTIAKIATGGWATGEYGSEYITFGQLPQLRLKNINSSVYERMYFSNGYTARNDVQGRSGSCLEIKPTNATYPVTPFLKLPATSNVTHTIKFWAKKSNDFNGSLYGGLMFRGGLVDGWDLIDLSTSYQEFTLSALSSQITESGIIELHLKTTGTIGSIYIDDISEAVT